MAFFEGFSLERVGGLRARVGGSGPAVVMLHGHPRTHTTWHRVAPRLADRFTVVCPDLPGYGESRPTDGSKRAMAGAIAGRWARSASASTPLSATTAAATSRIGWPSTTA